MGWSHSFAAPLANSFEALATTTVAFDDADLRTCSSAPTRASSPSRKATAKPLAVNSFAATTFVTAGAVVSCADAVPTDRSSAAPRTSEMDRMDMGRPYGELRALALLARDRDGGRLPRH